MAISEGLTPQSPPRRRLKVQPDGQNPKRLMIEVVLRKAEDATAFYKNWDKARRATSNTLLAVVEQIAGTSPKQRNRNGYLQPQVPRSLRERFEGIAGVRRGNKFMRDYIARWIDSETGKRRRNKHTRRHIKPRQTDAFIAAGRELIDRAKCKIDGDTLVRYPFNAKNMKPGINKLRKARGMTLSEFFTAAVDRACTDCERKQRKREDFTTDPSLNPR